MHSEDTELRHAPSLVVGAALLWSGSPLVVPSSLTTNIMTIISFHEGVHYGDMALIADQVWAAIVWGFIERYEVFGWAGICSWSWAMS